MRAEPPPAYAASQAFFESDGIAFYRSVRIGDGRAVVIKAIDPRRPAGAIERLRAEYEIMALLDTPAVVRPIALDSYRGMPALVLEDFDGQLLEASLRAAAPLPVERFLRLAIGVAAAVEEIHIRDVVHRDLKPESIVIDPATDAVKLVNFGIASRLPREPQVAQAPRLLAGSLPYMSPEQTGRMNRALDSRSDLYSLGVTYYRMLTGRLPFQAADPLEWIHCHVARRPTPPAAVQPSVPPMVDAIVMKLLAKPAEERYQSAGGLRRDLERCLEAWRARGVIDPFPPGEDDVSDRFRVPQRLCGREAELDALFGAFQRMVATGAPGLVIVHGYSGIGKSSLVRELHRPIVRERGYFISGKFDQYQRDIPYATISQAFRALTREILADPDDRIADWRQRLEAALGLNGRLVVDVVPELALVLGEQPPVPELPLSEAQGRFHLVFRQFVAVFATEEHPVALFLDDLQWVDPASLDLLVHIMTHPDTGHLLLIGAYRDNEVGASHPWTLALEAIRRAGVAVCDIVLGPLSLDHVAALVSEAFGGRARDLPLLARLIHERTGGNPFFAIQFLTALYQEGLVSFDPRAALWSGDIPRIRVKPSTDNVVDWMVGTLRRLPAPTTEALRLAACLGGTAGVSDLAALSGRSEAEVHEDLWEAVRSGLLLRRGESYQFVHDRIQEAAFSLTPEAERAGVHLRIGRLLLAGLSREELGARVFEVASHFEASAQLLERREEKDRVAELHLAAGRKAKASIAYAAAVRQCAAGLALLAPEGWDTRHELAFSLAFERAECEYLQGRFEAASRQFAALFNRARTAREKAEIRRVEVDLFTSAQQLSTALERGIDGLRLLGVALPARATPDEVRRELDVIRERLGERRIEELVDLPPLTDPDMRAALGILAVLYAPAVNTNSDLAFLCYCRMVDISLRYGNAEASALGYAYFGMMLGPAFGRYREGYQFGLIGYELAERRGGPAYRAKINLIFGNCIRYWTRHLRGSLRYLEIGFQAAQQTGDLTFACYCCNHLVIDRLILGEPLDQVDAEAERRIDFTRKANFDASLQAIVAMQRLVRSLQGRTERLGSFAGDGFDEVAYEAQMATYPWAIVTCWYFIMKLQARLFAGDYAEAVAAGAQAGALLWSSFAHPQVPEYWYYHALALAALASGAPPERRREALEALARHEAKLGEWADAGAENFAHKHALVAAEIARLEGRDRDALRDYDRAVQRARAGGFVHNEALAEELLARFLRDRGLGTLAETHLRCARSGYARWGAHGKVRQLEQENPRLIETPAPRHEAGEGLGAEQVDLLAVAKASQSISSELVQERLLPKLLTVVLEQSGAQIAHVVRIVDGALTIEASATLDGHGVHAELHPPARVGLVPASIVHYVHRTGERVRLADARADPGRFSLDAYVARERPRSVLCLPIRRRGAAHDILYLENNAVANAFRDEQLTVLELVAGQAAISLENATLLGQEQAARQAAEEARRRANFLAEAGELLSESLDYEEVPRRLTALCVRSLADCCVIDVVEEDGIRGFVSTPVDPAKASLLEELLRRYPPRADSPQPAACVMRSGEPMLFTEVSEADLRRYGADEEHIRLLRGLGFRTAIVAPLLARGRILGAITLVSRRPGIRYQRADLDLLVELARRAALAIDNARLHLRTQEALRLREEFLSVASHELRTPMTSLTLSLQTLARRTSRGALDPEIATRLIERATQQAGRMNRLVDDLLDVSRIEAHQLVLAREEVELGGLVREIVARFHADLARARCEISVLTDGPVVGRWDPSRLDQVVSNLLANAIKFGAGAPIEVVVSHADGAARLSITDHGIGVEPARQPRIFDRFERAVSAEHYGGLGLGLYICRRIVEAHGGSIRVASTPGAGSTFTIELPCVPSCEAHAASGGGSR